MKTMNISLPAEIEEQLGKLAAQTGSTKASYVKNVILEHLEDLDDLAIAEQRLADIRAGRSKTYALEEVERELGLAD